MLEINACPPSQKKGGGIKSWRGSTVSVLFPCARPYNPSKPHKPQESAASELKAHMYI